MKILLIQHCNFLNGSGGTEKICSFLANGFSDLGYQVEIATNQDIDGSVIFPLNDEIKVTNIFDRNVPQIQLKPIFNYKGTNPAKWIFHKIRKKKTKRENKKLIEDVGGADKLFKNNLQYRAKAWRNYIEFKQPDVIITMSVSSLLEITFGNEYKIPIINSTNGRPDYDYSDILWNRNFSEMDLLRQAYQKLSGIQILFESYKGFLPETFHGKCTVIPNPVPQFSEDEMVQHFLSKDKFKIINIASLATDCKQQHLAIEAFITVSEKFPNWELHFWGVGNDLDFLKDKINRLNLTDKIFLNGFTNDPISKLKDSDIFIFPSKYEGFGLALAEAMSVGLPSLAFSSCSGVNELIKHDINGFLAKDLDELKIYLQTLMQDSTLRAKLGKNAQVEMKNFIPENVMNKWDVFVKSLSRNS